MKQIIQVFVVIAMVGMADILHAASLRVAVTTSFNNSGLSDILLPEIKKDTGIDVRLLIVGTGQALRLGRAGDVDAILVHSKGAEEQFVSEGFAPHRREIMYNDFVLIGPADDPANVSSATTAAEALNAVYKQKSAFVSRGDESGTHRKELNLWQSAKLKPEEFASSWYRSVGAGMGAALNTASGMNAYIMSDRASWLKFGNKGNLKILFAGDAVLFNQYAYLPISKTKHPHVSDQLAQELEEWLVSPKAQSMIGNYKIAGETLFTPNAKAR